MDSVIFLLRLGAIIGAAVRFTWNFYADLVDDFPATRIAEGRS
jgi:hypothetical protein